jgi:putative membrane protein
LFVTNYYNPIMIKLKLLLAALSAAFLLQACHGNNSKGDDDTTNYAADTARNANIIVGKDDSLFVTKVAEGCLAEIKIGLLAKKQGSDKRVRNMGAMMVKDLTKGKGRLEKLASLKKIVLPTAIDSIDERSIAELAKKSGKDFDHAYLDKISDDYKKAMALFQATVKNAYDPQIKQFAGRNILTIQRHLDLIDAVHGSMKSISPH